MIRHHVSNLTIDVASRDRGDAARATSSRSPSTASTTGAGTATATCPTHGERWLFAHRYVRTDGTTPGGWAAGRLGQSS